MTHPLDPHTLRQAAARWPRETLSPRAAQSFLRSLWEEAEQQKPDMKKLRATLASLEDEVNDQAELVEPGSPLDHRVAGKQDLLKVLRARLGVRA
jgi:hypothetical protein